MYMPDVKDATRVKQVEFKRHGGVLLKDIESEGGIGYLYLLLIFDRKTEEVALVVSAETSDFGEGDAPFLCTFSPDGHANYGPKPEIVDIGEFEKQAVELAASVLKDEHFY